MGRITGADAKVGYTPGSTVGTAVALGAGDLLCHDGFNQGKTFERQEAASLGCGSPMLTDIKRGAETIPLNTSTTPRFNCVEMQMLADFMGDAVAGAEQNAGEGDYKHVIHHSATRRFGTIAAQASDSGSAKVLEFPSVYHKGVTIQPKGVPGYLMMDFDMLATDRILNSTTNTWSVVNAATRTSGDQIEVLKDADVWINTEAGGALASGDKQNIKSFTLNLVRDLEPSNEITGSTTDSAPLDRGYMTGTLVLELAGLDDFTYMDYAENETALKCSLVFEGDQIASGDNKSFGIYIPRMKLIEDPQYNITNPGLNPHILTFEILKADANPTGMSYTLPYFELTNTFTGDYVS
jgi:hypothetical protein